MNNCNNVDFGLLVGRFNPVHNGHVNLIRDALSKCNKFLFLIIGSHLSVRTNQNMFFVAERIEMIKLCFSQGELSKIIFLKMQDYCNSRAWVDDVKHLVFSSYIFEHGSSIGIFGFNKDASSYYLKFFPEFKQMIIENSYFDWLSSTTIRNKICGNQANLHKTTEFQFLFDMDTSEIDEKNMPVQVCNWIKLNFNPNIKLNPEIVEFLTFFIGTDRMSNYFTKYIYDSSLNLFEKE
jgi:bifunctional NMN adenylyltransferase/nudix hydrolase